MRPTLSLLGGWTLLALLACGGPPRDPLEALIAEVVAAAEARDAGRVAGRLAEEFEGSGRMGRAEVLSTLQRYFAGYESVGVTVYDVQAESRERVRLRTDFSGRPKRIGGLEGLLPSAASYRFDLQLATRNGDLVVSRASWEPWNPAE